MPFLPELAKLWQAQASMAEDGLILLPTRRAARELAAAFLRGNGGEALLLPRIVGFGAVDEAPLALAGAVRLAPAIGEVHRRAELARLIRARRAAEGEDSGSGGAWRLAGELARLMDEAERAEVELGPALGKAAHPAHALHWDMTLRFMKIVTDVWPEFLKTEGLMNPAARQVALLRAQAEVWEGMPPAHAILAVGGSGDIPAVGALLRVVAGLPRGMVVLPGLDCGLEAAAWEALDQTHPQYELRELLRALGADRGDVRVLGDEGGRERLLRRAMLPAATLGVWQEPFAPELEGISLLRTAGEQDEAVAVAMVLREALEVPDARAALVTPDRRLALRVASALRRFGVVADDSAGETLAETPPAVFLRLVAQAAAERLAPVALLALLKHPLAAAGFAPAVLRRLARRLERDRLRGPAPAPGLVGLTAGEDRHGELLGRLEVCLGPLLVMMAGPRRPPGELMDVLLAAGEAMAASDTESGPARLWQAEEGEALAVLLAEAREALDVLQPDRPDRLPDLLDALLEGAVVRSRRAVRGRGGAEHPRVFIWGLLEARLQSAELMVLGGLAEGVWPPATDPGPWMSRPMRAAAGLPSTDRRIGQAAQDFCQAACAAPIAVLSVAARREHAPAVPSRWISRLEAMLGSGLGGGLPVHPAGAWPGLMDQPAGGARPVLRPLPCPPGWARPRSLSVTEVGILVTDPYAIYARRVLGLRVLAALEEVADERDFGIVVHAGVHAYLRGVGTGWPDTAAAGLAGCLRGAMAERGTRPALAAWWGPRLDRVAVWVDGQERERRGGRGPLVIATEQDAQWVLERPAGVFTLRGRADRLECWADGVAVLDYKTGTVPKEDRVWQGGSPQLPLEACMAAEGAFGPAFAGPVRELAYWRLSGSHDPGKETRLGKGDVGELQARVGAVRESLMALVDGVLGERRFRAEGEDVGYAQLARAAEWGSVREEE